MEAHDLPEDQKCFGPESIPFHNCGSNDMEEIPKQDSNVDFDPSAPYSSSMDNVPLKLLFGVSNVKMRQSPTQEKAMQMDLSSPKDQLDSNESVRIKLRESLASALALVGEKLQKRDSIIEKNLKIESIVPEIPFNMDYQAAETEQIEVKAESNTFCDKDSPKNLKRDRDEFEQNHELAEAPILSGFLTQGSYEEQDELPTNADSNLMSTDMPENGTLKMIKLVKEEINVEVNEQTTEISDIIQVLGVQIEAELFRKYAGVNKKYKEKARSLLFNLKDRNNPELRARVVSGEITPQSLCCMTAEQLASKELSQWRIAKAEELAHMIVLPDSDVNFRRMVKKTHKGEFQVEVENDDVGAEVVASGLPLQAKQEQPENEVLNIDETTGTAGIHDNNGITSPASLPSHTSSGQVVGVAALQVSSTEAATIQKTREQKILPKIMSLDDYMGSRGDQLNEGAEEDRVQNEESNEWATEADIVHNEESFEWEKPLPGQLNFEEGKSGVENDDSVCVDRILYGNSKMIHSNGDQGWQVENVVHSPSSEKLWEGMLQLNPLAVESVMALFKSGEKTSAKEWSKFVEVKGRVRLDAFEKFLQELPLSRSRAVMVVSISCKDASLESSLINIQEIANSYKQDERVGYAEPAPGVELYLCPPDVTTLQMLDKFVSYEHFENIEEQDGLIGCVVWRRNNVASNVMHKMPERQYINAKKLALSGHLLDSPTHPGVSELVPYGTDSPKYDIRTSYDKYSISNRSQMMLSVSKTILHVENTTSEAKDCSEMDIPPGFNSCPARVAPIDPRINAPKVQVSSLHDDDNDDLIDDVPPGFGPNAVAIRNNAYAQTHAQNVDDDDLPEFDYNSASVSYQPSLGQLPQQICLQPMPSTKCSSQPPQVSTSDQGYFQPNESLHLPQSHLVSYQVPQQVPRPPSTPHPSIQFRELIQKYGHGDAPFPTGQSCIPDGGVNINPQISQQTAMIPPQHPPVNAHTQIKKAWNGEDEIPEWHHLCFPPGGSSVMQPMLPSQLGAPNFRGNFQAVHPPPSRVPPPQRGTPQMALHLGVPTQMLQHPHTMPQGPPPPFLPGLQPLTGIIPPVPMLMSERDNRQFHANNSQSFHTSYSFRPALSGPVTRPLDGRNRRV